jgi:hypothetical protein
MWIDVSAEEPTWINDQATDRELAANICAGCPVPDECLELEFRTAGFTTVGVWGGLAEDDRRATYLAWSRRRQGESAMKPQHPAPLETEPVSVHRPYIEGYAKASLKKYRPTAARNEDKKVFSGLL